MNDGCRIAVLGVSRVVPSDELGVNGNDMRQWNESTTPVYICDTQGNKTESNSWAYGPEGVGGSILNHLPSCF
jgi:hypothetical protein